MPQQTIMFNIDNARTDAQLGLYITGKTRRLGKDPYRIASEHRPYLSAWVQLNRQPAYNWFSSFPALEYCLGTVLVIYRTYIQYLAIWPLFDTLHSTENLHNYGLSICPTSADVIDSGLMWRPFKIAQQPPTTSLPCTTKTA